jgi:hypothetical protein
VANDDIDGFVPSIEAHDIEQWVVVVADANIDLARRKVQRAAASSCRPNH